MREVAVAIVWAPPSGFLGQFPNLRQIVSIGAGTDHLSSDPSRPLNVPVLPRREPASTRTMAEFVLMQVLLHHRRIADSVIRGPTRRWAPEPRGPVASRHISILGFGPMGQAAAELLHEFGCKVAGVVPNPQVKRDRRCPIGLEQTGHSTFLEPDLLINILPSTEETRGLIDERRLRLLPRGAGFINVGRGDAVEQSALLRLLDAGHLSLASLDVLPVEPPAVDDPIWTHPRVILNPHVASSPVPAEFAAWVATQISL